MNFRLNKRINTCFVVSSLGIVFLVPSVAQAEDDKMEMPMGQTSAPGNQQPMTAPQASGQGMGTMQPSTGSGMQDQGMGMMGMMGMEMMGGKGNMGSGMGNGQGMQGQNNQMQGMGKELMQMKDMMGQMQNHMSNMQGMMGMSGNTQSAPATSMAPTSSANQQSVVPTPSANQQSVVPTPESAKLYHIGSIDFFLDQAARLSLTSKQTNDLTEIKRKAVTKTHEFQTKIDQGELDLFALTGANSPKESSIAKKIKAIENLKSEQRITFIKSVGEANKVLSDSQRKSLLNTSAQSGKS